MGELADGMAVKISSRFIQFCCTVGLAVTRLKGRRTARHSGAALEVGWTFGDKMGGLQDVSTNQG